MASIAATEPAIALGPRRRSRARAFVRICRGKPIGVAAGAICVLLVLIALGANELAPHAPEATRFPRMHAPSRAYPLGTDNLFRDIYSRILIGSRISLGIGFGAVAMGTCMGTLLGLIAGYYRGWADMIVSRALEVVLGFPPLVLALFILSIFKTDRGFSLPSFIWMSFAIGLIITPTTARIVRGSVLSIRALQYIEAAESMGAAPSRIIARHVLPNVMAPIIVIASIQIGNAILAEAALSFIGVGISDDSHPSWGKMLQDTRAQWQAAWWLSVMPGAAISIAVLSFNLFGDALRDILDPRLRSS
ncbi:MAG: ABC transporter permease [Dehalococcoidia bacterium]|nr:ABC transporter permease [Dehalococcoidia bacterium]